MEICRASQLLISHTSRITLSFRCTCANQSFLDCLWFMSSWCETSATGGFCHFFCFCLAHRKTTDQSLELRFICMWIWIKCMFFLFVCFSYCLDFFLIFFFKLYYQKVISLVSQLAEGWRHLVCQEKEILKQSVCNYIESLVLI